MNKELSFKSLARFTGFAYLALFIFALIANFMIFENYVIKDNPALTVENLMNHGFNLRLGTLFFLVIGVLDIFVAWTLYLIFKQINKHISLLSGWLRICYTILLLVSIVFLIIVSYLLNPHNDNLIQTFAQGQIDSLIMILLLSFNFIWLIGLAVFGFHLITIGYLLIKSEKYSKYLGACLTIAGFAYIFDTLANILYSNYSQHANIFLAIVFIPAIIAELWFTSWLLYKGFKK